MQPAESDWMTGGSPGQSSLQSITVGAAGGCGSAPLPAPATLRKLPLIRLDFSIELNYEIDQPGCDFIFSIHAARTRHQAVVSESLAISQSLAPNLYTDPVTQY